MANPHPNPLPPRWKPGQSGNPSGRPKGLAHYIQAQTHKGIELVNWYLGICRGEQAPLGRVPRAAERFEAAQWFSDRGWGRPPQYVDLALASTEVRRIDVTFDTSPSRATKAHRPWWWMRRQHFMTAREMDRSSPRHRPGFPLRTRATIDKAPHRGSPLDPGRHTGPFRQRAR